MACKIEEVLHVEELDRELDEAAGRRLDEVASLLHVIEYLPDDAQEVSLITMLFQHRLPVEELEEGGHELGEDLQGHSRLKGHWWRVEAGEMVDCHLIRELAAVDELQHGGVLDANQLVGEFMLDKLQFRRGREAL